MVFPSVVYLFSSLVCFCPAAAIDVRDVVVLVSSRTPSSGERGELEVSPESVTESVLSTATRKFAGFYSVEGIARSGESFWV